MKNKTTYNAAVLLVWLLCLFFGAVLFSCSAVNRVNKDIAKQEKVIANYAKKHGFKSDTVSVLKKGDTVTNIVTNNKYDTSFSTDTVYITKTVTKTIVKTVTDTVVRVIKDKSVEVALRNVLLENEKAISGAKEKITELDYQRKIWRIRFYLILGAILSAIAFILFNKFKF